MTTVGIKERLRHETTIEGRRFNRGFQVYLQSPWFSSEADAAAFASMLPKSLRARVISMGIFNDDGKFREAVYWAEVGLLDDPESRASGAANETGLRRMRRAVQVLHGRGIKITAISRGRASSFTAEELAAMFFK